MSQRTVISQIRAKWLHAAIYRDIPVRAENLHGIDHYAGTRFEFYPHSNLNELSNWRHVPSAL